MSLPAPYYNEKGITIYHGDCREIMPDLEAGSVDLVLTDPPYGIGEAAGKNRSRSCLATSKDYGNARWDNVPIDAVTLALVRNAGDSAIIFGGNYYSLPPASCWLVWDKDNGATDFADCELAWTNLPKAVRKFTYRWQGMLQEYGGRDKEARVHPTQKPVALMRWCIKQAPEGTGSILDPYMGSGSTLIAARDLGCDCIGIEIEERYCEIARATIGTRGV